MKKLIKHVVIYKRISSFPNLVFKKFYLCNQACSITKDKIAKNPEDITCKNCLKILANYINVIKEVEENEND